jgi:hypothetical protein
MLQGLHGMDATSGEYHMRGMASKSIALIQRKLQALATMFKIG